MTRDVSHDGTQGLPWVTCKKLGAKYRTAFTELLHLQDGYVIFNSTVAANLGMTLNSANPNTYNLDLFNAERHTTGNPPPSTCVALSRAHATR